MKSTIAILSLGSLLLASSAFAANTNGITWDPAVTAGTAELGWITDDGHGRVIKLSNQSNAAVTVQLGTIDAPAIKSPYYAIDGRVRYQGVSGDAFLEMWSHFPTTKDSRSGAYFSRTLGTSGLMQTITGDSPWREFRLPFTLSDAHGKPDRLVVNLQLPGNGVVFVSPGQLRDYPSPASLMDKAGAWWSSRVTGGIGAVFGTLFGLWGGLLGWLAQAGKGRAFVTVSVTALIAVGVVSLLLGIVAFVSGQPYHVWYPFVLIGLILPLVMIGTRKNLMRHYVAAEERRMTAIDAVAR